MRNYLLGSRQLGLIILCTVLAMPALAQQRRFVSGQGSDTASCSLSAPCRSFDAAIAAVNPGGEVIVLDSAGYGVFTVDKAVSVVAPPGVYAGISVFVGNGITVQAGLTDVVVLRGLTLTGLGGENGLEFLSGQALHVEKLFIHGFANSGIRAIAGGGMTINDTVLQENGAGMFIAGTSTSLAKVSLNRVQIRRNSFGGGLSVSSHSRVTLRHSVVAGNDRGSGVSAASASTATSELVIENCTITANSSGISSVGLGSSLVRVSNSIISHNTTGLSVANMGNIFSRLNNTLSGNTTNGVFTGTIVPQ